MCALSSNPQAWKRMHISNISNDLNAFIFLVTSLGTFYHLHGFSLVIHIKAYDYDYYCLCFL